MTITRQVPAYLLDSVAAHSRVEHPREACGFFTGPVGGMPERFVPIPNVHDEPTRYFHMSDTAVLNAFVLLDRLGHDVLWVYHSHTRTSSVPSKTDVTRAMDLDAVHLICSTARSTSLPTFQAWMYADAPVTPGGFEPPTRVVEEIALDIIDSSHPDSPLAGLVEGNRVRLVYDGGAGRRTIIATIGQRAEGGQAVTVYPARPGVAGPEVVVSLDRIRRVTILEEGQSATAVRSRASSYLAEASLRLAAHDTTGARDAVGHAVALMPRLIPPTPALPRAYRPRRRTE